jgi:hypothetical protein
MSDLKWVLQKKAFSSTRQGVVAHDRSLLNELVRARKAESTKDVNENHRRSDRHLARRIAQFGYRVDLRPAA